MIIVLLIVFVDFTTFTCISFIYEYVLVSLCIFFLVVIVAQATNVPEYLFMIALHVIRHLRVCGLITPGSPPVAWSCVFFLVLFFFINNVSVFCGRQRKFKKKRRKNE